MNYPNYPSELDKRLVDLVCPADASPRTQQAFLTFNRLWRSPATKKDWGRGLTNHDAIMIRCFHSAGIPWQRITDLYKIGYYTLRDVVTGKTWKDSLGQVAQLDELEPSSPKPKYLLVLNNFGNDLMNPEGSKCLLTPCSLDKAHEYLKSTGSDYVLEVIQSP